jgi:hypothetical protein
MEEVLLIGFSTVLEKSNFVDVITYNRRVAPSQDYDGGNSCCRVAYSSKTF